jgi:Tol biopolymer transport system component
MLWTRTDGTGQPEILTQSSNPQNPWSFTPDGKQLMFVEINPATGADIWKLPVESGASGLRAGKPEVYRQTQFHERGPRLSPDGHWLTYFSNETGQNRVYVEAFPNRDGHRQVLPDGTAYAEWSRKGNHLFYLQLRPTQLMAVPYESHGNSFVTDKPRTWASQIAWFASTRSYDVAPDGKRIVVLMPAEDPQEPHDRLTFLLNFFDELQRRVPAPLQ